MNTSRGHFFQPILSVLCLFTFVIISFAGCNLNTKKVESPLDPKVTRSLFLEWRLPRFGTENPQSMNNAVWECHPIESECLIANSPRVECLKGLKQ